MFHSTFWCLVSSPVDAQLDDVGLGFVKNSISAIEKRGKYKIYTKKTNSFSLTQDWFPSNAGAMPHFNTRRQPCSNIKTNDDKQTAACIANHSQTFIFCLFTIYIFLSFKKHLKTFLILIQVSMTKACTELLE